jgi:competence protein ComGC
MRNRNRNIAENQKRKGHTLVEMAVVIPSMTLLFLGLASAIKIAAISVPDESSPTAAAITTSGALEMLCQRSYLRNGDHHRRHRLSG